MVGFNYGELEGGDVSEKEMDDDLDGQLEEHWERSRRYLQHFTEMLVLAAVANANQQVGMLGFQRFTLDYPHRIQL